jgi:hypothetical protein
MRLALGALPIQRTRGGSTRSGSSSGSGIESMLPTVARLATIPAMRKGIGIVAALIAVTACSEPEPWDVSVKVNFLDSCRQSGGTLSYCSDAVDCLEARFSQEDFTKEEAKWLLGEPSDVMVDAVAECMTAP